MSRIGILLALCAVAAVVTLGTAAGAAAFKAGAVEGDWSGVSSADPSGATALSFVTLAPGKGKGGKKGGIPFKFKRWGMGAPVTCTGPPAPYSGYQLFPGFVGSVGDVSFPGMGRGGKLRVHNGRVSDTAVDNVVVYGIPKRIEYTMTARFTSPRTATGTLQVSTLWSHGDGTQTSCASGPHTWSACAWDTTRFQRPACAGIDPVDLSTDPTL